MINWGWLGENFNQKNGFSLGLALGLGFGIDFGSDLGFGIV